MKTEKAIEILSLYMKPSDDIEPVDFDSAILLGIEALKVISEFRQCGIVDLSSLLPGEDYGEN